MKPWGFNITMPVEWIDSLFRKKNPGEVRLRKQEALLIKGCYFEVVLISKDGVMIKPLPGIKVVEA